MFYLDGFTHTNSVLQNNSTVVKVTKLTTSHFLWLLGKIWRIIYFSDEINVVYLVYPHLHEYHI